MREAIFNLVSMEAKGRHAVDVFAGTGALGLEALSRGATSATFIERHIPTAHVVRENIKRLGVEDCCELIETSAFLWSKRDLPNLRAKRSGSDDNPPSPFPLLQSPWLIFVSPPYDFFVSRQEDMLSLVSALLEHSPDSSTLIVEADERFDFALLPGPIAETRHDDGWDVRTYPPAVVGVWRKA